MNSYLTVCERPVELIYKPRLSRDNRNNRPFPELSRFFPESTPSETVMTNGIAGVPIRFPVSIWTCPVSFVRGWPINRAVHTRCGNNAFQMSPWFGPVVVLKYGGTRCTKFVDMSDLDLALVLGYFMGATQ